MDHNTTNWKIFIDNYPFKSLYKVWPIIKKQYPNVRKKEVEQYLSTKPKDVVPKDNNRYNRKTFTNYIGGWQMDLFVLSKLYYLLCININTRFIYVSKAITNKNVEAVLPEIKAFVDKHKPLVIFCDNEGAFTSRDTVEYLVDKDIELKVVTEQLHSSLGILNRACRTIRDMLDASGRELQVDVLHEVVDIYNRSVHSSTGMSPKYMSKHHDVEQLYIINCLLKDMGIVAENDYDLDVGTKVRYVLDKKSFAKVRHKISKGYYTIDSVDGNNYVIIAKDGTTKKVPRSRLVLVKDNQNVPQADTIEEYNANRGVIEEILDYNVRTKKYKVKFTVPNGDPYVDTIPASYMREASPTRLSALERQFFNKNKDKYKVNKLNIMRI